MLGQYRDPGVQKLVGIDLLEIEPHRVLVQGHDPVDEVQGVGVGIARLRIAHLLEGEDHVRSGHRGPVAPLHVPAQVVGHMGEVLGEHPVLGQVRDDLHLVVQAVQGEKHLLRDLLACGRGQGEKQGVQGGGLVRDSYDQGPARGPSRALLLGAAGHKRHGQQQPYDLPCHEDQLLSVKKALVGDIVLKDYT
jgi:hypothetical protein